jgi:(2Fe-2S) ferredoxin
VSDNAAAARPKRHRTIKIDENAGPPRATARVCEAASCVSGNAGDITTRLAELTEDKSDVLIKRVGCLGLCAAGPLIEIAETGEMIEHVSPDDVQAVVADVLRHRLLLSFEAEANGITPDTVIQELLSKVPVG